MFHLFADVRVGDEQEKEDWKKHLNSMQEKYWRVTVARMGAEEMEYTTWQRAGDAYLFPQLQILIRLQCLGGHRCTWKHKPCLAMLYSKAHLHKYPMSVI